MPDGLCWPVPTEQVLWAGGKRRRNQIREAAERHSAQNKKEASAANVPPGDKGRHEEVPVESLGSLGALVADFVVMEFSSPPSADMLRWRTLQLASVGGVEGAVAQLQGKASRRRKHTPRSRKPAGTAGQHRGGKQNFSDEESVDRSGSDDEDSED